MKRSKYIDHTLLKAEAEKTDIERLCEEALRYDFANVCVNSYWVRTCAEILKNADVGVCTVVGFPLGAMSTKAKAAEAAAAIQDGADEIDMVINIGALKDKNYDLVRSEISAVKEVCGQRVLKVIIETCLLTEEEKIKMCQLVTEAGADFIKTSTGFSKAGATFEDVALFAKHVGPDVKIKAAGGISSFADAEEFLRLGASRLGTSRLVKIENS